MKQSGNGWLFLLMVGSFIFYCIWHEWNEDDDAFNNYVQERRDELHSLGFEGAKFPKEKVRGSTPAVWMYEFYYKPSFRCDDILIIPKGTEVIYLNWSSQKARFLSAIPIAEVMDSTEISVEVVSPKEIDTPPTSLASNCRYSNEIGLAVRTKLDKPKCCTVRIRQLRAYKPDMLSWSEDPKKTTFRYVQEDYLCGEITLKFLVNFEYDPPFVIGPNGAKYRGSIIQPGI